jgi:uncharacterized protein (TIGR02466 family)
MYQDIFKQTIFYTSLNLDLNKLQLNIKKINKQHRSNESGDQFNVKCIDNNFIKTLEHYANEYCNFLSFEKVKLQNMWLNINRKKDLNSIHDHPDSVLSGIFYIKTPEKSGKLIFINDFFIRFFPIKVKEYNPNNSEIWSFIPKENYLYIFPSWLKHEVKPNLSEEERISLAFNFK